MIISASYKTDIPCFYGTWFMNRLQAGYCKMINPYSRQTYRISLARQDVDGFIFWTKNLGPFIKNLPEVHRLGYPFVVQYTITGYPRALEQSVIEADQSVEHVRRVAAEFGPKTVVWRYDPILLSSLTPLDVHVETFTRLAGRLEGAVDEVVLSFAHFYSKTKRNLALEARRLGFTWEDPDDEAKRDLVRRCVEIAGSHGIRVAICSQNQYVTEGTRPARCVDAERLGAVAGRLIVAERRGNRPDCDCYASKDIGEYDTCPHGCVYCYAVQDKGLAQVRYRHHDPAGEFLFPPTGAAEPSPPAADGQLRFDL
ncbi:MAG TPA: DUF1848 domain-containing protein [Symbiobacteriaceae bacterium]|nr:DUF1848 domain-containing protein [Symbiobacteriaceae bacterium]